MRGWGTAPRFWVILAVLVGAPVPSPAQDGGWEAFLQAWRKTRQAPLSLLVPAPWDTSGMLASDPVALQLSVTGDLRIQPLSGADLERVRKARAWGQAPHWLALHRKGEVLDEGVAPPSGETLRGLLLSAGFKPTSLQELRDAVQTAWQRFPDSGGPETLAGGGRPTQVELGELWVACGRGLPSGQGLPDLPALVPVPGRVWPMPQTLNALASQVISTLEPIQMAAFLDKIPLVPPSARSGPDDWRAWRIVQSTLAFWRMGALTEQGRWPEAIAALQDYRRLSGSGWEAGRASLKGWVGRRPEPSKGASLAPEPPPQGFLEVFDLPALPDPPVPPSPPGLRLVVWGKPAWISDWAPLRATGPLATYGPDELTQVEPSPGDTRRVLETGFFARGWAVFRGDGDILTRGEAAPDPDRLALQLEGVAPSRLQVLDAFLRTHPDHLDARKARYTLVRARLPQSALEARAVEDAAAAWLPLDFGPDAPWISDLDRWRSAARKLLPELQAALDRWPDSGSLWQAWVSWGAFLPKPPSVLGLARELPVFGSRSAWAGRLPAGVHRAILREGLQARRFQDLEDWFSGAWEALRERTWPVKPDRASEDQEKAIFEGYRETLRSEGQDVAASDLERAWAKHVADYGKGG